MPLPKDIVFVRHGQSEANIVQKKDAEQLDEAYADLVNARADWRHRLTPTGVEQAKRAGEWIRQNLGGLESFDVLYFSPFIRTRETAAYLSGNEPVRWTHEDRVIERDWGEFGRLTRADQQKYFPFVAKEKKLNPWYARLTGGESLMDVYSRVRDMQGTLAREYPGGRALFVTHGDTMNVWRYAIERMLPEEWEELDKDSNYAFKNCSVLQYTRVNPQNPMDIRTKMHWRRLVHTVDTKSSPDNAGWVELPDRRRFTPQELFMQTGISPSLLEQYGNGKQE